MLRKIFFELVPRARHDPLAGIDTAQHSAENMARERSRFDIATRRSSPSLKINFCLLAPDENPVVRRRMLGQILASLRWFASRRQLQPMHERKRDHGEGEPGACDRRAPHPIKRVGFSKTKLRAAMGGVRPPSRHSMGRVSKVKGPRRRASVTRASGRGTKSGPG